MAKQLRMGPLLLLAVPGFLVAGVLVLIVLSQRPVEVGLVDAALRPCPDKPNCVCSTATDPRHAIQPLDLGGSYLGEWESSFARLVTLAGAMDGARLVTQEDAYAHLTFTTPVLRFVDDLELRLDADEGVVHVRSASRVGHSDLGANRKRVAALRAEWQALLREDG